MQADQHDRKYILILRAVVNTLGRLATYVIVVITLHKFSKIMIILLTTCNSEIF